MADIPFQAPFRAPLLRHPDSDDSNRTQTDTYQFEEKPLYPHPHPPRMWILLTLKLLTFH